MILIFVQYMLSSAKLVEIQTSSDYHSPQDNLKCLTNKFSILVHFDAASINSSKSSPLSPELDVP